MFYVERGRLTSARRSRRTLDLPHRFSGAVTARIGETTNASCTYVRSTHSANTTSP